MLKHIKAFLAFGVPFGLLMGLIRLSDSSWKTALWLALTNGLLFGLLMTVWAGWWNWMSRRRLQGLGFEVNDMKPRQERKIHLADPPERAFDSCMAVLKANPDMKIIASNAGAGTIDAKTGMSMRSFGEVIKVSVTLEGTGTAVVITSHPDIKATLVDGGKGVENVETFLRALQS